jgi:hypothetical protein
MWLSRIASKLFKPTVPEAKDIKVEKLNMEDYIRFSELFESIPTKSSKLGAHLIEMAHVLTGISRMRLLRMRSNDLWNVVSEGILKNSLLKDIKKKMDELNAILLSDTTASSSATSTAPASSTASAEQKPSQQTPTT